MNRNCWSVWVVLLLVVVRSVRADLEVIFAEDPSTNLSTLLGGPNTVATPPATRSRQAAAEFLARLTNAVTLSFEDLAAGTPVGTVAVGGDLLTFSPTRTISTQADPATAYNGEFALSGRNFIELTSNESLEVGFDHPQWAFGFYGTDVELNPFRLRLLRSDGSSEIVPAAVSVPQGSGGVFFLGVIDTARPFQSVIFENSGSLVDNFAFDDLTIASSNPARSSTALVWVYPADLLYGTPLTDVQLNASANVPGSFIYTPPAGTVLEPGAGQVLRVVFTPADTNDTPRSASVRVNVVVPPATLRGLATDALTRQPLAGVRVRLAGREQTTGPDGSFSFTNLPPAGVNADFRADVTSGPAPLTVQFTPSPVDGAYTIEADKAGYVPYRYAPIELVSGQTREWSFSLSPAVTGLRLVLNWGARPRDLDAHLLTPPIDGVRYHIEYSRRYANQTNRPPFAQLDADATAGFGPETITIVSNVPGLYHYYVVNYRDEQGNTGELVGSDAVTQIYSSLGLLQTLRVPTTGTGTVWDVCVIDGVSGTVTPINRLVDRAPDGTAEGTIPPSDGTTGNAVELQWNFGDGQGSPIPIATHEYARPGSFDVSLRAKWPDGRTVETTKRGYIRAWAPGEGPPRLAIRRVPAGIGLMWQTTEEGWVLEYRTDLAAGPWLTLRLDAMTVSGSTRSVQVPAVGERFFRLRK